MEKKKVLITGSVYDGTKYLEGVNELPLDQALSLINSGHAQDVPEPSQTDPPADSLTEDDPPIDPPVTDPTADGNKESSEDENKGQDEKETDREVIKIEESKSKNFKSGKKK